jgi:hypothetical protein
MVTNDKVVIHREEYVRLKKEHELLAILRSYGIEEWEYWDKAINILEEGNTNGYR